MNDGWVVSSWITFGFACVSLLVYPFVVYTRGRMLQVAADFDAELPGLTIHALSLPPAAILTAPLLLIALMLTAQLALPRKRLAASIHLTVILLTTCLGGFLVTAFWLPMVKLMQAVT